MGQLSEITNEVTSEQVSDRAGTRLQFSIFPFQGKVGKKHYGYNFIFKLPENYIYFKESIFFSQIEQLSLNSETILNSYVSTTLTRQSPAYFMNKYYCKYTSYSQSA